MFLNFWKMFLRFFRTLRIYFVIWHNFFCASGFEWIYTHNGLGAPSWLAILKNHGFVFVQKMYSLYNAKTTKASLLIFQRGTLLMRTWCSLNFFPIPFPMFSSVCTIYFYFSHQIFMVEDRRQICSLVCLFPYTQHKNNNSHGFSLWFFFQFSFLTAPLKEALWLSKHSLEVIRINWRSLLMTLRRWSGWKSATSHNFITTSAPPLTVQIYSEDSRVPL